MAGVNGVEIKVGQVWRTRGGEVVTVFVRDRNDTSYPWGARNADGDEIWLTNSGRDYESVNRPFDLIELVKDENGFTIWRGGTQPVPLNILVEYRLSDGTVGTDPAGELCWEHEDCPGDIVAYKVVSESTTPQPADSATPQPADSATPQPADSATLAKETLSALGWTFDGQAWVEQPKVAFTIADGMGAPWVEGSRVRIEMLDSPVSAPALLTAAAKHMHDRAATYDKPEGERSMAQTVAVFEAYHGIKLTEAQGWHFMQVLKDVRLFTRETYHGDSAEDCIAYAALKAEAKAQENPHG